MKEMIYYQARFIIEEDIYIMEQSLSSIMTCFLGSRKAQSA